MQIIWRNIEVVESFTPKYIVRRAFDKNIFDTTVLKQIEDKRALGDEVISRMKQVGKTDE